MDALSQTRRAMERTLLLAVSVEALVGRVIVKGLEKKPQIIKGVPEKVVPPGWYVALDYLALFLLYFVTVVGVLTLVVGRLEARARWSRASNVERAMVTIMGVFTLALAAAVAGGATNHGGPPWLVVGALAGVALTAMMWTWLQRPGLSVAAGVTMIAAPVLVYAGFALLTQHLWTENEIFVGEAKAGFGSMTRLALTIAAVASPYLLAPRPFTRSLVQVPPVIAAVVVATAGAIMLKVDYLAAIGAINRGLGLALDPRAVSEWIAFYLLAFTTIVWTAVACLTAPTPARRRLGVGMALVVLAGLGFPWPMNFAVAAVGLLAMADASTDAEREEQRVFRPATPVVDDERWQAFVGQLVNALRADGGDASAVSVRGDHGRIATVVLAERHAVPVRLSITRVDGCVVTVDLVCGREVTSAPRWTALARPHGQHPEPPAAGATFTLDLPSFDAAFRCRGHRDELLVALDADAQTALGAGFDGWLAGWPGAGVRHRVHPGHGAPLDLLLPLSELAGRAALAPTASGPLLARIELCAGMAARLGAGAEPTVLADADAEPDAEPDAAS
ncbi:MAG: hypothetical protein IPL61_15165 [Myxococcales bacterium]|nr:hypothetical protein [Myxococcales bacterium]